MLVVIDLSMIDLPMNTEWKQESRVVETSSLKLILFNRLMNGLNRLKYFFGDDHPMLVLVIDLSISDLLMNTINEYLNEYTSHRMIMMTYLPTK